MSDTFFCGGCARQRPVHMRIEQRGRKHDKCSTCVGKIVLNTTPAVIKARAARARRNAEKYRTGKIDGRLAWAYATC